MANAEPPELEKKLFVWHGAQSPEVTRQNLMEYVNVLSHNGTDDDIEIYVAEETGESAEFWMTLGFEDVPEIRKKTNHIDQSAAVQARRGRLCRFYFEGSEFKANEIINFAQKDLSSGGAYLLDSGEPEVLAEPDLFACRRD